MCFYQHFPHTQSIQHWENLAVAVYCTFLTNIRAFVLGRFDSIVCDCDGTLHNITPIIP